MVLLTTGRLPAQLVPLVGRQRELHDVVDTLSRSRLVTLAGPGGTGKTRLALAAADAARVSYPHGVCWVELAPIDDPGVVALAVAGRLGARESPGQDRTETIAEHVGERSMLIVLDNCEHLAEPAAELPLRLLAINDRGDVAGRRHPTGAGSHGPAPQPCPAMPGRKVVAGRCSHDVQ